MRILLVSDHYPPFVGGVQRQTRAMAKGFLARGHQVGVATVWQDMLPPFEDDDGYPVWRIRQLRTLSGVRGKARRRHQPPGPDPVSVWNLRRLIRTFRPDVVHASGWFAYAAAAALWGSRVPLLVSVREYGYVCTNASFLYREQACSGPQFAKCLHCSLRYHGLARGATAMGGVWLSKPILRAKAAGVHSVSHFVEESVSRSVFRSNIPHAVIPSFFVGEDGPADPNVLADLPNEPFILFVGALRRVKGVGVLFDAYRGLCQPPPLVMLGTREKDTPEPPPNVRLYGGVTYGTVEAAWNRSLFGVMPSLWPEPFGSVIHEGMRAGRAVIGTVPGGHSDMIEDGVTGLLVPAGDTERLRESMARLIEDPRLRERLGAHARLRAERFSAERVLPQFERLYSQVAKACQSAGEHQ